MPNFRYRAVNGAGEIVEGTMDAPTQWAAVAQLNGAGLTPIRAEEARQSFWSKPIRFEWRRRSGPSLADLATFTRELAMLLDAGLPLDRALSATLDLGGEDKGWRLDRVVDRVRSGATLAQGLTTLLQRGHVLRPVPSAELAAALDRDVAVLMLTHINYRSGAMHDIATPYGMEVTLTPPECLSDPVDHAKVRSPMSTVSVAGFTRSLVNEVRTLLPGDAPPAVYWEKFAPYPVLTRSMYSRGIFLDMSSQYTVNRLPLLYSR